MKVRIDHLGIAVRSIDDSLGFYREALALNLAHTETLEHEGVNVALLPVGESRIELLEPLSDDTVVGRFINKRGEGLHHICFEVESLETALESLKSRGGRPLDGYPRQGAEGRMVAFVHPSSANGVLIELVEKIKGKETEK